MRILFDQSTPAPLRDHLTGHSVDTAFERGWSNLRNGTRLDRAEADGYELLITTDQSLRHQQNLGHRRLGVLALLDAASPAGRRVWWRNVRPGRTAVSRRSLACAAAGNFEEALALETCRTSMACAASLVFRICCAA